MGAREAQALWCRKKRLKRQKQDLMRIVVFLPARNEVSCVAWAKVAKTRVLLPWVNWNPHHLDNRPTTVPCLPVPCWPRFPACLVIMPNEVEEDSSTTPSPLPHLLPHAPVLYLLIDLLFREER